MQLLYLLLFFMLLNNFINAGFLSVNIILIKKLKIVFLLSGSTVQSRQANLSKDIKLKDNPQYYGKPIAKFKTNAHDVSGMVYAATDDTFYITDFHYDGQGPGKLE